MKRNPLLAVYDFFSDLKLLHKLLLSYLFLIILPLGLLSVLFYNNVARTVENHVTYSAEQAFDQTFSFLSYKIYNLFEKSNLLLKNNVVINILENSTKSDDLLNQVKDMQDLQPYLVSLEDKTDITRVRMYIPSTYYYSDEGKNIFNLDSVRDSRWYKLLTQSGKTYMWLPTSYLEGDRTPLSSEFDVKNEDVLSLAKLILHPGDYSKSVGVIRFDFTRQSIVEILKKANSLNHSLTYIQNSRNDIVISSSTELLDRYRVRSIRYEKIPGKSTVWMHEQFHSEKALVGYRLLEGTDWVMVTVIPFGEILAESKRIKDYMLVLVFAIGTAAYLVAYILSVSITKRISRLAKKMRETHNGRLEALQVPPRKDEIGLLVEDYNYMTHTMTTLIQEQYKSGQELKNAELKALQAQINPHFLYNTLDMINWYAWKNMGTEIISVVEALARFYKLSLSKGRDIVTVRDELAHVSCYFQIQNMRFKNRLDLKVDVDEVLGDYSILKITLQPIVENAILHGLLCKESKSGTVTLSGAAEDGLLLLKIEDDGIGMTPEKVSLVLDRHIESKSGSGYGVRNINERIKLYYGDEYGLSYTSEYGKGTVVEIRLPARKTGFE